LPKFLPPERGKRSETEGRKEDRKRNRITRRVEK
jgi:hypothetical protein